jgi:hypothetical protein
MICSNALCGLLQRGALCGGQFLEGGTQDSRRQFQCSAIMHLHAIKASGVFKQGRIASAAHIRQNSRHSRVQLVILSRLECQQPVQLRIEIWLPRGKPSDVH